MRARVDRAGTRTPPRVSEVQERELGQAEEVGVEVRLVTGHRGVYYIGSAPIPLNR